MAIRNCEIRKVTQQDVNDLKAVRGKAKRTYAVGGLKLFLRLAEGKNWLEKAP